MASFPNLDHTFACYAVALLPLNVEQFGSRFGVRRLRSDLPGGVVNLHASWNRAASRNPVRLSSTPYVSVVLPVRDCERYVGQAVESIVEQTFRSLELIVVDDGSSDRTLRIVADWAARDKRIQVLARPRSGLVAALESGRAVAKGVYIARMDADDVADPERVRRQVEYLDLHADVVVVGGQIEVIDVKGRSLGSWSYPVTAPDCRAYLKRGAPFCHPTVMIRSGALALVGGYRSSFEPAEDMDLWLRLEKIGELANLDVNVLHYRAHAGSITRTYAASQAAATALALVTARFPAHEKSGFNMDRVGQDTWANTEALLPKTMRCYAREAYLRALSLNGGIVNPEDLALLYASLPTFVRETSDKRVLAFGITRATYQLCRARKWYGAIRLALEAVKLFPLPVFADLSTHLAARLTLSIRRNLAAILQRIRAVWYRLGAVRLAASFTGLVLLALGAARRAIATLALLIAEFTHSTRLRDYRVDARQRRRNSAAIPRLATPCCSDPWPSTAERPAEASTERCSRQGSAMFPRASRSETEL